MPYPTINRYYIALVQLNPVMHKNWYNYKYYLQFTCSQNLQ